MLSSERPDRISVASGDPRLVANAGLVLPLTIDLDSTICETYGLSQGGSTSPQLQWPAGLSPLGGRGCDRDGPTLVGAQPTFCVRR